MRQFRPNRSSVLLGLTLASVAGTSQAAFPLLFQDEDAALFSAMVIDKDTQTQTTLTTVGLNQPMFCANLINSSQGTRFAPVLPGFTPAIGNFKFGGMSGGEPGSLTGVNEWRYARNGLAMQPYENVLTCYVLTSEGVRKVSPHLFSDTFDELAGPNASVVTRVMTLPDGERDYKYLIDINIPAQFAGRNFVLRDGFDSSIFDTGQSRYCEPVNPNVTECTGLSPVRNNVDYQSVVPAGGLVKRFIVNRPLHTNVIALPVDPDVVLTAAALFIAKPTQAAPGPEEQNLQDNVSVGRALLSDLSPMIHATAATVPLINEGSGVNGVSFSISDDTSESGLPPLNATVSLDFNGNTVPVNATCVLDTAQAGETVRRTCTFNIPVFDPDFATDIVAGTYVTGVSASVRIVATDGRNQTSTKIVPFHVLSQDNDAPSFTLSSELVPDPTNNNMLTMTCDLSGASRGFDPACLGNFSSFVLNRKPGPQHAYDENGSQTAFFAGVDPANNKLNCTASPIFANVVPGGLQVPKYVISGNNIGLTYQLAPQNGHSDCWVVVGDQGGQDYKQTQIQFRIKTINAP